MMSTRWELEARLVPRCSCCDESAEEVEEWLDVGLGHVCNTPCKCLRIAAVDGFCFEAHGFCDMDNAVTSSNRNERWIGIAIEAKRT